MRKKSYIIRVSENFKKFLDNEKIKLAEEIGASPKEINYPLVTERLLKKINNSIANKIEKIDKKITKFLDSLG